LGNINYEEIYRQCAAICPEMRSVIEYIQNISHQNNEIQNTINRLQSGDTSAIKRFIELYLKTALKVSFQASRQSGLPLDELFSEAVFVISQRAIDLTDNKISQGMAMSKAINKRLQKYISEQNDFISYELTDPIVSYDVEQTMLRKLYVSELHDLITDALHSLSDRYETVLDMRYGINCNKHTVAQIAEKFKVSTQNIYVREQYALKKLRESSEYSEQLRQYLDI